MAENGNAALFLDLAGTLVKMDETRQLPLDNDYFNPPTMLLLR